MKTRCFIGLLCLCLLNCRAADPFNRVWTKVTINGKPATLLLDTGADGPFLFRPAARRLNLRVTDVPSKVKLAKWVGPSLGLTEKARISFLDHTLSVRFGVVNNGLRWDTPTDGLLGWPLVEKNLFQIRYGTTNVEVETLPKLPNDIKSWNRFRIKRGSHQLILEIPAKGATLFVLMDTGNPAGMCLPPAAWQRWQRAHSQQLLTLTRVGSIYVDPIVTEESKAAEYTLGTMTLTDIPVMLDTFSGPNSEFDLVMGLAMLNRMDMIVDGKHSCVYLRPKTTAPRSLVYNRAGMAFMSRDLDTVARVVPGSPGDEAGVRDGDILMQFDGRWRTSWTESPNDILCNRPAGTQIELVLKRDEKIIHATVTLRDILGPKSSDAK